MKNFSCFKKMILAVSALMVIVTMGSSAMALDGYQERLGALRERVESGDADGLLHYFQQCRLEKDKYWTP